MSENIITKVKFGVRLSPLQQRVQAASRQEKENKKDAATMPNRIGLMLDVSGSMAGEKMDMLRLAGRTFLEQCSSDDTACAINTFEPSLRVNMSTEHSLNASLCHGLNCLGGTPMADAMQDMLHNEPLTRGVLVSDGQPNDQQSVRDIASDYREAQIPIDTVHIGESDQGEELLKYVAEITGGKYLKFTDVTSFGRSFKYLTPGFRAMLNAPNAAELIGATEVK
jgi:Mg-chelatase subunit ChlD